MPPKRILVRKPTDFRRHYHRLGPGDAVVGLFPLRAGEEIKFLDLTDRGVIFFPAALAQLVGRSKVAQAEILAEFMLPGGFVAYGLPDLAAQLTAFYSRGEVVSKRERAHLGLGVSLWPSLEALYSLAGLHHLTYPLVVQPLLAEARDLRVVMLGDYVEAYERVNPHGFRKNVFQGGVTKPAALTAAQLAFCRRAMARARFPYAILDLLVSPVGEPYLSEIGFKGGLTGARLSQEEFRQRVARLEEEFIQQWENSSTTRP